MSCDMPPELRSYLEGVLDDALAQIGMTIHNQHTRQRVLWKLLKELDSCVFLRVRAALPPSELTRSIPNVQAFAQEIFADFRAHYVTPSEQITRSAPSVGSPG